MISCKDRGRGIGVGRRLDVVLTRAWPLPRARGCARLCDLTTDAESYGLRTGRRGLGVWV